MLPVSFPEQNDVLRAGQEDVMDLNIYRHPGGAPIISCWQFSKEEMDQLQVNGGHFWFYNFGPNHYPIKFSTSSPFKLPKEIRFIGNSNKVGVYFQDDDEIVVLDIEEGEHSFKIEKRTDEEWWTVTASGQDGERPVMEFGEPLTILGTGDQYQDYHDLIYQLKRTPEKVLILDRVNKTV